MMIMRPAQQGHGGSSWLEPAGALSSLSRWVGAVAVGEEAIMSNAMEAGRQHVEQETPHELADVEAHDFALVITALPIVLPAETDEGLVEIEQAAVGDRDAMRIAREIGQDLLGTGEGLFGIDDP